MGKTKRGKDQAVQLVHHRCCTLCAGIQFIATLTQKTTSIFIRAAPVISIGTI